MRTCCSFCFALILTLGLAACAWRGATPTLGQSVAGARLTQPAAAHKGYKLVYNFPGGAGGSDPIGGLTFVNRVMFGTTASGGEVSGCSCGTVHAGKKVIYAFKGVSSQDGADPNGGLLFVGSKFYGETDLGGRSDGVCAGNSYGHGCGTVYQIDTSGNERVIYRFKGGSDGEIPVGGLVSLKGVMYGVTKYGGSSATCDPSRSIPGCGVVFSIDSSGHEKVIYRFKGAPDGAFPVTKLLSHNGEMYGTTAGGGSCGAGGCGTVFSVSPSGSESVIYAFKGNKDGMTPASPLIAVDGSLYGTTFGGGCARNCGSSGWGIIFKVTLSGSETVLHRFIMAPNDGTNPEGPLVFLNGRLFGTTAATSNNAGTIYSATSKTVKFLHHFESTPAEDPNGPDGLTLEPSTQEMYGVARSGGKDLAGAIFRYTL
jgi:uncharacterized repeat protein (TIGR03803 family)